VQNELAEQETEVTELKLGNMQAQLKKTKELHANKLDLECW
jgi:hypothetical protein